MIAALQKKISCSPCSSAVLTPASSRCSSAAPPGHATEPGLELRADLHQQQRVVEVGPRDRRHPRRNRPRELVVIPRQHHRPERRHAHRAADRSKEDRRRGRRAHPLARRDILHGDRVDRLQQPHAEAGDDHRRRHIEPRRRRVHAREQNHARSRPAPSRPRRAACTGRSAKSSGRRRCCRRRRPSAAASAGCPTASPTRRARPA